MKRITRLLLAAIMIFSLTFGCLGITASAASVGILKDLDDIFTEEQEANIRLLLDDAAAKTGFNFCIVSTDDIGSQTPREYASNMLNNTFGADSNSVLLLICNDFDADECYDWIDMTGNANRKHYSQIDDIYDRLYSGLETDGYYASAIEFCKYFGADSSYIADVPSLGGFKVNIADYDDVLSPQEQTDALEYMQICADEIQCNIGVVITDDLGGMSDYEYTKNFLETSFGAGADGIALLFNNDRSNMSYVDWIYTYGQATDMYGHRTDDIFDYMYAGFDSDGGDNYYQGITYFCTYLSNHKDAGNYDDYYSGDDYYYESDDGYDIMAGVLIPVAFAGIVTFIVVKSVTAGYKKKKPVSARSYMDAGRTKYLRRDDIYLRETTTHVRISSSSGGGGGSRGGGGGRSRSGGGGGGGRRR